MVAKMNSIIEEKSFKFATRIVKLYDHLKEKKSNLILLNQLLKAGTSIGANVVEAEKGQSKPDFYAKMSIALKEANETIYWINLLHETDYLSDSEFESIEKDAREICGMLVAITKTTKENISKNN
ncbi:MAG: four helix bundle protein [Ruminococcaceae bacterium]|nr:four helix bundle protein [Oscillospiraceae bacterium]